MEEGALSDKGGTDPVALYHPQEEHTLRRYPSVLSSGGELEEARCRRLVSLRPRRAQTFQSIRGQNPREKLMPPRRIRPP